MFLWKRLVLVLFIICFCFRAYKLDYEMFGYDFNDVLKMADYPILTKYETQRLNLKQQV